jgi:ABC-type Fe3+-citrate transport system substrate-binding protein
MGTKKQKQLKEDTELIQKITGKSKDGKKMERHRKAQQDFMGQIRNGMQAFAAVLSAQNDINLLNSMSPGLREQRINVQRQCSSCE